MIGSLIKLQVYRHSSKHITTGYDTFKHDHDPKKRKRDYARFYDQKKASCFKTYSILSVIKSLKTSSCSRFFCHSEKNKMMLKTVSVKGATLETWGAFHFAKQLATQSRLEESYIRQISKNDCLKYKWHARIYHLEQTDYLRHFTFPIPERK